MGNPPFVGYTYQSVMQKDDLSRATSGLGKNIDYVSGWYYKASQFIENTEIKVAFVSTNSITQGEQVSALWKILFRQFKIHIDLDGITYIGDTEVLHESELSFDHSDIIRTAIKRLRNRIDYTDDAFKLLKDEKSFTIYEMKKIYEAVKGMREDTGNFRRSFYKKYVDTGIVKETGEKTENTGYRDAKLYCKVKNIKL